MKTRNDTPKSAVAVKKTPPARKTAIKTPPKPPQSVVESITPKTAESKRVSAAKARQTKKMESPTTPVVDQRSAVEEGASGDGPQVKAAKKVTTSTRLVAKRSAGKSRTPTSSKVLGAQTTESVKSGKESIGGAKEVDVKDATDIGTLKAEPVVDNAGEFSEKKPTIMEVVHPSSGNGGSSKNDDTVEVVAVRTKNVESSSEQEKLQADDTGKSSKNEKSAGATEKENMEEEPEEEEDPEEEEPEEEEPEEEDDANAMDDGENAGIQLLNKEKSVEELHSQPVNQELGRSQEMKEHTGKVDHGEQGKKLGEDDPEEAAEEIGTLEEECMELSAIAKERKIKKEHEIFVGGLDRDAVEDDLKKVFEKIGEVVEVRLHKNASGNKNKGYGFVKFANKEHAKRALTEMKNPVICGKRCGTAPCEDNDVLFVGNICNTWTKEAIKKRLKDYDIEGVERINLVQDIRREGLSRGFAFIEFSCHADAMLAYKRLQKPDVIFGHAERTVKVAFAEPLAEPDPEIMAQVKSVFLDGIPSNWDEKRIREKFKGYGEIERIVLARNISRAKRKDFGFVDFSTHEAAVACIDGVNSSEFGDGVSKMKMKARLLNPMPKTQAVKGEISGGFRIGHGGRGSSKSGKGSRQGSTHVQHGRGFHHAGWGESSRIGFSNNSHLDHLSSEFNVRQNIGRGGRRGSFQGDHFDDSGRGVGNAGLSRLWHGAPERSFGFHASPSDLPFPPERQLQRPFVGQHIDDPYLFDDDAHGIKRPFSMIDPLPDYVEPSRLRPRLDYTDPEVSFQGSHYRGLDAYRSGSSLYSHDYNGPDFDRRPYSSFYGGGHTYRGGYYY